jgi:hypothetical protein
MFAEDETILRFIYSPYNYKPGANRLKPNFLKFDFNEHTSRFEMSCNRLIIEKNIEHLTSLGNFNATRMNKVIFAGLAKNNVKNITAAESLGLQFTPDHNHEMDNYSHCDIFIRNPNFTTADGRATNSEFLLFKDEFSNSWDFVPIDSHAFNLSGLKYSL